MRIAVVDPSLFTLPYDGALIEGLAAEGHQVVLHGRALRREDGGIGTVTLAEDFYRVAGGRLASALPAPLRLAVKGVDHAWSMWRLLAQLRRTRPDVIHFQWLPLPMLDGRLLRQFRAVAPLVLTVHDTNPFNGDPSAALQARGFRRCLDAFDQLVVHTAQGAAAAAGDGRAGGAGRGAAAWHAGAAGAGRAGPDGRAAHLPAVRQDQAIQGTDLLIEAFAALPEALRQQARLRVVGKPYMELAPLQALAAAHQVPLGIEAGFVADDAIGALFGPNVVAMFPYREIEASGVMFLALAHGRPVIASRLGSFAELLVDGEHGHLLPPGDVSALRDAMAHMIADRGFTAHCAAAVRTLADGVPSWREIARRTVQTYRVAGSAPVALRALALQPGWRV